MAKKRNPVKIGSLVHYHGEPWRVGMIGLMGGERYYWLVRSGGEVAMVPAVLIEEIEESEG